VQAFEKDYRPEEIRRPEQQKEKNRETDGR